MNLVQSYIETLSARLQDTEVTDAAGAPVDAESATLQAGTLARRTHANGNKLMFIGNGGSAGICSHMAIDYSKNGGLRSLAFNDGAALTCLGNDLGYENVFAKQVEFHGCAGDLLIAISSSGRSPNILNAAVQARAQGLAILTLSGFAADNPLRRLGDLNFYLPDSNYGFVEIGHLTLLHAVLDIAMGWKPDPTKR